LVGIAVGLFFNKLSLHKENQPTYYNLKRLFPDNTQLVNPLISVDNAEGGDTKLESIKYSIIDYVNKCKNKGYAANISVYLRDLNKGTWIGIDADRNFTAASLLKVPLLIGYLKLAEQDPSVLNREIKYEIEINGIPQNIVPENGAQLGKTYTVNELLRYMIAYSDNVSTVLLSDNIDAKSIANLYSALQISAPDPEQLKEYPVSARIFATFFRVLYNATYLNPDYSQKAMKLLTETDFGDGIVAGVPENIPVAHKFGERRYESKNYSLEAVQLHDCGIVYHPKSPYLICIMTEGRDFNSLKDIIKDISRITYEHENKAMDLL